MKLQKILFLAMACSTLAGCDFFGSGEEGKADGTLYELTITTNLEKAKDGIRAELTRERDQDEIDELLDAGASQEDIDKSGTCVDGKYYFFDQDPINLYEPFLPGYEFLGWYAGDEFLGYLDVDYDGNPDYMWNMPNENTTIEARFQLMQFSIMYMDSGVGPSLFSGNPTTWNVEQEDVVLEHLDRRSEGLQFDGWTFAMGGATRYDGYVTKLDEQFLIDSGIAKEHTNPGQTSMTFSLHENYSEIKHNVKLTFDNTVIDYVIVEVTPVGGVTYTIEVDESHFIRSGIVETQLSHNAEVVVIPTLFDPDSYAIDGIYYGSQKISTEVPVRDGLSTGYKIIASVDDAEVELRCEAL